MHSDWRDMERTGAVVQRTMAEVMNSYVPDGVHKIIRAEAVTALKSIGEQLLFRMSLQRSKYPDPPGVQVLRSVHGP